VLDFDDAPVVPVLAGTLHRLDRQTVKLHFNTAKLHQAVPGLALPPTSQQDFYVMEGMLDGRLVRYESNDLSSAIDGFFQVIIEQRKMPSSTQMARTTRRRRKK
jgi:hypothetical protein